MKNFFTISIGAIIYIVISVIAIPFLSFNFGAEPTFLEKIVGFFIKFPFGFFIKNLEQWKMIFMLILNGVFWSTVILKGVPIIKKMILK